MSLISREVQFVSKRFANELFIKKKKRNALVDYLEIYRKKTKSEILIL